jgi:hypothetical protein
MEHSPLLEANSRSASQKLLFLMKPASSLPSSQEAATGPYPEPAEFSPHPISFISIKYFPLIYAQVPQVVSPLQFLRSQFYTPPLIEDGS